MLSPYLWESQKHGIMSANTEDPTPLVPGFRAGFVALIGLPNVGKSTLLNQLVSAPLSIVTPKAQTTRRRFAGIYSDASHQAVFLDTPGLIEARYLLQEAMRQEALGALRDADVVVYVVDAGFTPSVEAARSFRLPTQAVGILCLNKVDRLPPRKANELLDDLQSGPWVASVPTVGTDGRGIGKLRERILEKLPESPPYYPTDELSDEPVRFFAGEMVREACFNKLNQELPYSLAVRIDEFTHRSAGQPIYIAATLFVEKNSQKGIVIGAGGRKIREIGTAARKRIAEFLEQPVYLDLRVKVLPNWRKKSNSLRMLGFRIPPKES